MDLSLANGIADRKNAKEIMVIKKSKEIDNVSKYVENTAKIIKNIYIKNKLVNFITKK